MDRDQRPGGAVSRAIRAAQAALWGLSAGRHARGHLRGRGMDAPPQLPPVPEPASGRRAVEGVLRVTRRSCLERTLVMQAWHSAAGSDRDIVVGVRGPS